MEDFKFDKNGNWGEFLMVESDRLEETIEFIKSQKIKNIAFNKYWGYKLKNIRFIEELRDIIEGIIIVTDDIDIEGINSLWKLKLILISDKFKYPVDYSVFKNLERCNVYWNDNYMSLSTCKNLSDLVISKFKLTDKNKKLFLNMSNLRKLTLIQGKVENLEFLKTLENLEELEISYMSSLKDIEGLAACKKTLKKLILDHCKNISNYVVMEKLKELVFLNITDSQEIENLEFIPKLNHLEHFAFVGTSVVNGDLRPCIGIKYVGFDNKKHYSHKFEELNPTFKWNLAGK
jgi:hypothetical protein